MLQGATSIDGREAWQRKASPSQVLTFDPFPHEKTHGNEKTHQLKQNLLHDLKQTLFGLYIVIKLQIFGLNGILHGIYSYADPNFVQVR